jgi:hypothetical protein
VLYLGDEPVPHAAASWPRRGRRDALRVRHEQRLPRTRTVAQKLSALGIPAEPDEVVTSAQAAARTLAAQLPPARPCWWSGPTRWPTRCERWGCVPVRTVAEAARTGPAAVVQGLARPPAGTDLAEAAVALARGALWVAGQHRRDAADDAGTAPGQRRVRRSPAAGHRPGAGGVRQARARAAPRLGRARPGAAAAGRRRPAGHRRAGRGAGWSDSLLVLTGVVGLRELLDAPAGSRPTYVSSDLRGLLQAHPPVEVDGSSARCGTAAATVEAGRLIGNPTTDDGVRAMAAMAWSCADRGEQVEL